VGVPTDDDGIRVDYVADAMRYSPKFLYILPNFQNPAGVTLSEGRRYELLRTARMYGAPIVEDDPYGELRYEGGHIKPLYSLDAELARLPADTHYTGNVIYLGTFSKTLAPGLRIAWAAAAPEVISRLVQLKQGADLHTSSFNQMVIYEVAKEGFIDAHVDRLREVYRKRRDAMLAAMDRFTPPEARWTYPAGGLFLWLHLPDGLNAMELFEAAIKRDVAFVPGDAFYTIDEPPPRARINFSNVNEELITEGVRRLAEALKTLMAERSPIAAV
jgi:2-aminoadipate transaminase